MAKKTTSHPRPSRPKEKKNTQKLLSPEVLPALPRRPETALIENFDISSQLPVPVSDHEVAVYYPDKLLDPLTYYIREISKHQLLSLEQEQQLTKALAETGDIEIAKKLVVANLRLVVKIAMEYRNAYHNLMDLIQEGNIGLMKAVSKYDPGKGAKLSYYASWWIRSYIL